MNYSTEQAANLAILVGFVLKIFKIEVATEELTTVIASAMVIGGIAWNWWKRYQRGKEGVAGAVNILGFRK